MQLEAVLTDRLTQQGPSEEEEWPETQLCAHPGDRGLTTPALTPEEVTREP